jgi:predicted DNA-binding transcriptional regulator AlpA
MSEPLIIVTPEQLKALIEEAVKNALAARRAAGERLLDLEEAAELLSVSTDWLYHNAKKLPFTRKIGPRILRFSYQGMLRSMESKQFGST